MKLSPDLTLKGTPKLPQPTHCSQCGAELAPRKGGRPKLTCGGKCRMDRSRHGIGLMHLISK